MSEINSGQNNQAYQIQCDTEGAKFSQVSDTKLSFKGTNWLSRLALRFGFWLSNKFLSSRCVAKDIGTFKPFLSNAWENMYEKFQDLKKANPFTCFMFACRMAHSFDKASSGRMSISTNDVSLTENENIPQSEQGRPNEVSNVDDSSGQKHNEGSNIREYLSRNNALPPEAPCFFDCKVFISSPSSQDTDMRIYQNCEIKINLKNPGGEYDRRLAPTRNVIFSEKDCDSRLVIITGEYCDESDNNTWKQFSCTTLKERIFRWQSVNNSLDKLARDETIDLNELIKGIRGFSSSENVINATAQGETDGGETKLKIDYTNKGTFLCVIDSKEKISLDNTKISKGPDLKHVIVKGKDRKGQERSFTLKLSDLISNEKWEPSGTFAKKNGELILLSEFLYTKFGKSLRNKKKVISFDFFKNGEISEKPFVKLIVTGEGKFGIFHQASGILYNSNREPVYIQKNPDFNGHVSIYAIGDQDSYQVTVKLADLLSEDGWVERKKK